MSSTSSTSSGGDNVPMTDEEARRAANDIMNSVLNSAINVPIVAQSLLERTELILRQGGADQPKDVRKKRMEFMRKPLYVVVFTQKGPDDARQVKVSYQMTSVKAIREDKMFTDALGQMVAEEHWDVLREVDTLTQVGILAIMVTSEGKGGAQMAVLDLATAEPVLKANRDAMIAADQAGQL